jgi:hypothetical protein
MLENKQGKAPASGDIIQSGEKILIQLDGQKDVSV